jgi:hypothetical protein
MRAGETLHPGTLSQTPVQPNIFPIIQIHSQVLLTILVALAITIVQKHVFCYSHTGAPYHLLSTSKRHLFQPAQVLNIGRRQVYFHYKQQDHFKMHYPETSDDLNTVTSAVVPAISVPTYGPGGSFAVLAKVQLVPFAPSSSLPYALCQNRTIFMESSVLRSF